MKKILTLVLSIILIIFLFEGCGTTSIRVPVTRPAEVNMLKFKKLMVIEFEGHAGNKLHYEVVNALMSANKFELIDRKYLTKVLYDNGMTFENMLNSGLNNQVGNIVGNIALISGNISNHDFKEEVKKGDPYKEKEKTHVKFTRYAHVSVSINFQITDLNSGKIIYSRQFNRNLDENKYEIDKEPGHFDKNNMLEQARKLIIADFMKKILPYSDYVSVELFEDSDVPDFEKGIKYAKNGFWEKAIPAFQDGIKAAKDKELQGKGYYNLGIAYQFSYIFDEAIKAFDKAFSIDNQDKYIEAIRKCKDMEADYRLLNEQLKQ